MIVNKQRAEPYDSWSQCFQRALVETCLELAPEVFEAAAVNEEIKLRLAVSAPRIGIRVRLNWKSPAFGLEPAALLQSWEIKPTSYSDNRIIRDWSCRRITAT